MENGAGAKVEEASRPRPSGRNACGRESQRQLQRLRPRPRLKLGPRLPPRLRSAAPAATGAADFRLPELGENIDQGDLVRLMISPGSKVSEGQPVMELETDKAVVEVPSSVTGTVKEIKVKEGEKVKVGQVIFTLEGGASRSRRKRNTPRSNTFPNNTKLACRCRPRSRPRAKPRPKYFCRTSLSRMLPKLSPCRSSWAKWPERNIAHLLPPRLTFAAWREKSA